jgi:hypothetical protein
MTFLDIFAHKDILRRKRRGIQPEEIQSNEALEDCSRLFHLFPPMKTHEFFRNRTLHPCNQRPKISSQQSASSNQIRFLEQAIDYPDHFPQRMIT